MELNKVLEEVISDNLIKIVISNPRNKDNKYKKIIIKPILVKENIVFQFEKFTITQAFHSNLNQDEAKDNIINLLTNDFKQADIFSNGYDYSIKISKKNKILINRKKNDLEKIVVKKQNKEKSYLLKEGLFIEPLYDLNIINQDGKINKAMYDKFKQINRYLEMIEDSIKDNYKSLNIIDFGCGKSYLTFVLYYYLVHIKKIDVHMIGLDLKEDVINNCNKIADKYGYKNLKFEVGNIDGYNATFDVDMVISLHACDTASDHAIYNAIKWNSKMIFSVPCCQHEINGQIKSDRLPLLTKYGLLKERFSSILTDEMRANLIKAQGYKVQILEFIDLSHSPKNILIRAIKNEKIKDSEINSAKKEVEDIINEYNLDFTLYNLLYKN